MEGSFSILTRSPEETRIVGAALGSVVLPGDVVSLGGDLGSGKTVLVQGLAASLGVVERVTSPTFTIHQQYRGRYLLSHVDVYRLESFQEVLDLGLEELIGSSILVVEWGNAIAPLLPSRRLEVRISMRDREERQIVVWPESPEWLGRLQAVRDTVALLLDPAGTDPAVPAVPPGGPAEEPVWPDDPAPARDDGAPGSEPREEGENE